MGQSSTEEGTSELDLDDWIDCLEEILFARVKKDMKLCGIVNKH